MATTTTKYGVISVSVTPMRKAAADTSEMVSQLLWGELILVKQKEETGNWLFVQRCFDGYQAWIDTKHCRGIAKEEWQQFIQQKAIYTQELVTTLSSDNGKLLLPMGCRLDTITGGGNQFLKKFVQTQAVSFNTKKNKPTKQQLQNRLRQLALQLINTPYLWGGCSTFGIDCSGFTQLLYKLIAISLLRDAKQQITQGSVVQRLSAAQPGDLAFFSKQPISKKITHVGLLINSTTIVHAHGLVCIDDIDTKGIIKRNTRTYSHYLKQIKRYF